MNLSAMPPWARLVALGVAGLGVVSVVAIPFVDATRALPGAVAEGGTYSYVVEPSVAGSGNVGRVRVSVVGGAVTSVEVLSCRSGLDCVAEVAPYVPYEALATEVGRRGWTIRSGPPLLEATYDDPATAGEERSVRVLDYREG